MTSKMNAKATAKCLALIAREHASAHREYRAIAQAHFVAKRHKLQKMFQRRAYHEARAAYHFINQARKQLAEV